MTTIDYSADDEYKASSETNNNFSMAIKNLLLESGEHLDVDVNYSTYGALNAEGTNALVVCHAMTGNAEVASWWGELLGPNKAFDTSKYYIVCANILGSCFGTTGPTSFNPVTGTRFGPTFPKVTVRDSVQAHAAVLKRLGVTRVVSAIGGSLGGMQALEWGFLGHEFVQSIIPIACGSHHSAWQIGTSELQRQAIFMDPRYQGGDYDPCDPPYAGLSLARQIAMVSYRTHRAYKLKYGRQVSPDSNQFHIQSYLHYQGDKFLGRFDVNSYVTLTQLMDTHDVGRHRGGCDRALASLSQPTLVVGIDSDVLYPISEQHDLAASIPHASLEILTSCHGHDGFLLEQDALGTAIQSFLAFYNAD